MKENSDRKICTQNQGFQTTVVLIIFWNFFIFYQIFSLPHAKPSVFTSNKNGIIELFFPFNCYLAVT